MAREMIRPTNVHEPAGGYHHAVKVGNTIYTSGQVGLDLEGNLVGKGDFLRQVEQAFENLKNVLEAAGASMADIVQLTMYVTDYSNMDNIGDVWVKYLGPTYPPVTAVEVSRLQDDYMVEINAKAVVD
jgi:2-iminobutanoate/2-iminopropanoate deaminase